MPPLECKRKQIIDAAIAEFQKRGFEGANMDRIAACAEVSKRTVYNHFESKEALFRSIADRARDQVLAAIQVSYEPDKPLRSQLLELGRAEGRLLRSEDFMDMMRMGTSELLRDPDLARRLNLPSVHEGIFGSFFRAATESGALSTDDPDRVAKQFLGMIKTQAFWPAIFSGALVSAKEVDRIVEASVDTIVSAYGTEDKDA